MNLSWKNFLTRAWPYLIASIAPLILWAPVVIGGQFFGHSDPGVHFIPFFQFYGSYLHSYGSVPLWNNYIFSGFPSYASVVGGFFYPLSWLYAFFSAREVYAWLLYFNFALAGIASVRLGRLLSISRGGSLIAALAYIFCSQAIEWGVNNLYYTILWILPVIFICLIEISQYIWPDGALHLRSNCRRFFWATTFLILAIAVGWLASAAQLLLYTITVAIIASLYLDIAGRRKSSQKSSWYSLKVTFTLILSSILATAIGLIQIIPSLRLLPFTARTGGLEYSFASRGAISIINFYRYLWPEYEIQDLADWSGVFLFIGVLPLIFALYSFKGWKKDWRVPFFACIFLFSLAVAIRWSPLKYLVFHAPIYNLFRGPARWMFWGSFGLAFLAGIGWDKIKERGLKRSWFIASTLSLLGLILLVRYGHLLLNLYHLKVFAPIRKISEYYLYILFRIKPFIIFYRASDIFSPDFIAATILVVVSILVLYVLYLRVLSRRLLEVVVIGVILVNLITAHPTYRQMVAVDLYEYIPQTVTLIREHHKAQGDMLPFRVFVYRRDVISEQLMDKKLTSGQKWIVLTETLTPNVNMYYDLESVEGYDNFASTQYEDFLAPATASPGRTLFESEEEAYARFLAQIDLLSFMNVKYIISATPIVHTELVSIGRTTIPSAGLELFVYFNTGAKERVRWADSSSNTIILNDRKPGYYHLTVTTDKKQVLILAESFLPKWQATVDDNPITINSYGKAFQSIEIIPGTHEIQWEYLGL